MPYPRKLLNDYETVALDLHPHWWYFAEAAVALVGAIVLGIVVLAMDAPSWLKWVAVALIVLLRPLAGRPLPQVADDATS